MVLQHSLMGKSLLWHISNNLLNAKVGTFPPSYAVIPSFISCSTTFYCIDVYFIFKLTIFKILVFLNMLLCIVIVTVCTCYTVKLIKQQYLKYIENGPAIYEKKKYNITLQLKSVFS